LLHPSGRGSAGTPISTVSLINIAVIALTLAVFEVAIVGIPNSRALAEPSTAPAIPMDAALNRETGVSDDAEEG
jgi:hypothetical protein